MSELTLVLIESTTALASEPTRVHIALEQWAGPVLGITKPIKQNIHDREAYVKADEIGQLQWSHGMVHAELHYAIDTFARRYTFVKGENRFIDHRHQHAIRYEPRRVLTIQRSLAQLPSKCLNPLIGLIRRSHPANHFHQFHHRHRIHEVHADHFVSSFCCSTQLCN